MPFPVLNNRGRVLGLLLWLLPVIAVSQKLPDYFPGSTTEGRDLPSSYRLEDVQIGLMRGGCFGTCPVYQVVIFGDGRVIYTGRDFVRVDGEQHDVIAKEEVLRLLQKAYNTYFFEMHDSYNNEIYVNEKDGIVTSSIWGFTDRPSQYMWIKLGDYQKVIHYYTGAPANLVELTELVDEVGGVRRWIE